MGRIAPNPFSRHRESIIYAAEGGAEVLQLLTQELPRVEDYRQSNITSQASPPPCVHPCELWVYMLLTGDTFMVILLISSILYIQYNRSITKVSNNIIYSRKEMYESKLFLFLMNRQIKSIFFRFHYLGFSIQQHMLCW